MSEHPAAVCLEAFRACEKEKVEELLEGVTDSQVLHEHGLNPLHRSAALGWLDTVETLMTKHQFDAMSRDDDGFTSVHTASVTGQLQVIKHLICNYKCDPTDCKNNLGTIPLHTACFYGHIDTVRYFIDECKCDPMQYKHKNGGTPLHSACAGGHVNVVEYLITECKCDPMSRDKDGYIPLYRAMLRGQLQVIKYLINKLEANKQPVVISLHIACYHGHLDVVRYLIEECKCDPQTAINYGKMSLKVPWCNDDTLNAINYLIKQGVSSHAQNEWYSSLYVACSGGHVEVVKYLIESCKCTDLAHQKEKFTTTLSLTNTPLHSACRKGHIDVVRYLVEKGKLDPMRKGNRGNTPLHEACASGHLNIVEYLVTECKCDPKITGVISNTPLHEACAGGHIDVVKYLINECKCNPKCKGSIGTTPLHLACASGHVGIVKYMISKCGCDPQSNDLLFISPIAEALSANKVKVLEFLLCSGKVNSSSKLLHPVMKNDQTKILLKKFSNLKSCNSVSDYVNVFIVGNSGVGKTTLTQVIRQRENGLALFTGHRLVSNVELLTAGIIPYRLEHKELGNIILHDLAGQPQYYSSHSAILENILEGSPAVFIIVSKLSDDPPHKWLSLIKDLSQKSSNGCCLLTVASHADAVDESERYYLKQKLETHIKPISKNLEYTGIVALDCRKLGGESIVSFTKHLSKACQSIRCDMNQSSISEEDTFFQAMTHCKMLYQVLKFKEESVYTMKQLLNVVYKSKNDYYLPESEEDLLKALHSLHLIGLVMFISTAKDSWVILDKKSLLNEVNGGIFGPKSLVTCQEHGNNTGIVSQSVFRLFDKYDSEMLVEFMINMKLCERITPEMIRVTNLSQVDGCECRSISNSGLLFFPSLMNLHQRPNLSDIKFGWCLQCTNQYHYFSPRFLHLLILRLAYQYALPKDSDNPYDRRCTIWSTGIVWSSGYGVNTLVELVDNDQCVILLMYSQEGLEHNMVPIRRAVITDILSIQQEYCPSLQPKEFIIDSSELHYPLDNVSSNILYDVEAIASSVVDDKPCVVAYNRQYNEKRLSFLLPLEHDRNHESISIFLGRSLQSIKLPGGHKLPVVNVSSPADVLKKYSAKIQDVISDPERLASHLNSANLISNDVKSEIVTSSHKLSRYRMASIVINDLQCNMTGSNSVDKLNQACSIMKTVDNISLKKIAEIMEEELNCI